MRFSMRPYLMAGVGIVAAGSIAIPPSVAPPSHSVRHETVALTAHNAPVNPLLAQVPEYATAQAAAALLPPEALTSTAALTETLDAASAQVGALALPGLGNAIMAAYDVIMPWVDWAVNLGIYATQWIPVVNWFTPQISIFYYGLIEPIITSAVFNIAYWVGGAVSFGQGLANFVNDTVNAGIGFVNAEIDWFLSFLPPLPPFFPLAAQATMDVMGARTAMQVEAPVEAEAEAATATDETSEPTAPLPEETETALVDEVEAEPTTPQAPVDSEPLDENASDLEPTDERDQVDEDLTDDSDFDDQQSSAEDLAETSDDTEDTSVDIEENASDLGSDDGPDAALETSSDTGTDTTSDSKPDRNADTKSDAKADSGSDD